MTDAERKRAFEKERRRQWRHLVEAQRGSIGEVKAALTAAKARLAEILGGAPTDFQSWQLGPLQTSIDAAMEEVNAALSRTAAEGAAAAHGIGTAMLDEPLKAGGIRIAALVNEPDLRQLAAIRTFMVDRMDDVTAEIARKVKSQLALTMVGTQTPAEAATAISSMVDGGQSRAITIVRTEMGRAFSVAQQERQEQASEHLPGLKKQWRRSGKRHSRIEHDLADGQVVAVSEPFIVNGIRLRYPRDPKGPAAETINCGCVSLPYMESWEVRYPDRTPFTDEEQYASPMKRDLARELNPAPDQNSPGRLSVRRLEGLSAGAARRAIVEDLASESFRDFVRKPPLGEHRAVAAVDDDLAASIGSASRIVRLSSYTVVKQRARRRSQRFSAGDYARVQSALESGTLLRDGPSLISFYTDNGTVWRAVVKVTRAGDELYLQSLHRSDHRHLASSRKKLPVVRE